MKMGFFDTHMIRPVLVEVSNIEMILMNYSRLQQEDGALIYGFVREKIVPSRIFHELVCRQLIVSGGDSD